MLVSPILTSAVTDSPDGDDGGRLKEHVNAEAVAVPYRDGEPAIHRLSQRQLTALDP